MSEPRVLICCLDNIDGIPSFIWDTSLPSVYQSHISLKDGYDLLRSGVKCKFAVCNPNHNIDAFRYQTTPVGFEPIPSAKDDLKLPRM